MLLYKEHLIGCFLGKCYCMNKMGIISHIRSKLVCITQNKLTNKTTTVYCEEIEVIYICNKYICLDMIYLYCVQFYMSGNKICWSCVHEAVVELVSFVLCVVHVCSMQHKCVMWDLSHSHASTLLGRFFLALFFSWAAEQAAGSAW